MRILENFNESQLQALIDLKDTIGYKVLQDHRKNLIAAMKERAWASIHFTEEQRIEHARQHGHAEAWKLDDDVSRLAQKELDDRKEEKKKN